MSARKKANKDKHVDSDAEDGDDDDDQDAAPEKEDAAAKSARLPPIHKIDDIFSDLTANAKGLVEFAKELMENGERLRVATMCR